MLDSNATTVDWQRFTGDVAILPIGSIEQHSAHLPIAADWIEADSFARKTAEAINAALLPALPYANCLEHSGFRGSFSLRPETLMQVVRDLAEEIERQNFKILIVINGHGGNFSLIPALRDWNRQNRPLKILLVNFWEHCDPKLINESAFPRPEVHAGAWETSIMMALRPDLVRSTPGADMPINPIDALPLERQDLTTFGVGHFNPTGAVGFPASASARLGGVICTSIIANLVPWLNDRIARLRNNPRYSGAGGILVRPAVENDLPESLRLKRISGWNQTGADITFIFNNFPSSYWVAVHNGKVIGTTTAAVYDQQVAWIGMVLVDPEFRRQGVGRQLMIAALEKLQLVTCIKLDATPDGKKLYDTLGFKDDYLIHRMTTGAAPAASISPSNKIRAMQDSDLPAIIAADQMTFGVNRAAILSSLFQRAPQLAWISKSTPTAFCLGRAGSNFTQIGPVVAPSATVAQDLIQAALTTLAGQPVIVMVPASQPAVLDFLKNTGFFLERTLMRMYLKENRIPGQPQNLHAIAGPEFG
ncbi:MAG: GNAT family N-acetyltransferase [bacterium]